MTWRFTPTWRLTGWYVMIIMIISLMFSTIIYEITVAQIRQSLPTAARFETDFAPRFGLPLDQHIADYFEQQYESVVSVVRFRLVFLNLGVLVLSSVASYYLAKRTLRPIERSLDDQRHFTADASHELRTPLAAMKAEIEVALKGKDSSEHIQALKSGLEEITKLEQLSSSLLHLARHEEGGNAAAFSPVELAVVTHDAIARVQAKAEFKHVTIEHESIRDLVLGDQNHLTDLLVILLDNAIKYSPEKSLIRITSSASAKHVVLQVVDSGIGIHAADLPHIFNRFYRADPSRSKEKVDGYGLGLAIAKQIVDNHQGTISIASIPGKGTTVSLSLRRFRS